MALDITAVEWRNNNENIRYPFADSATLLSEDNVEFDKDVFSDARLYFIGSSGRIYLGAVDVAGLAVTLRFYDTVAGYLGWASYDGTVVGGELSVFDQYGRVAGILVSTEIRLAAFANRFKQGETLYAVEATEFAPTVLVPLPNAGVQGLLLDDGSVLTGEIWLVGEDGVVLSYRDNALRVDVVGNAYALVQECEKEGFALSTFCGLKTINEISPDAHGDFKLLPGGNLAQLSALRVESAADGQVQLKLLGIRGMNNG